MTSSESSATPLLIFGQPIHGSIGDLNDDSGNLAAGYAASRNEDEESDDMDSDSDYEDSSTDGYDSVCDGDGNISDAEESSEKNDFKKDSAEIDSQKSQSLRNVLGSAISEVLDARATLSRLSSGATSSSEQYSSGYNNLMVHNMANFSPSNKSAADVHDYLNSSKYREDEELTILNVDKTVTEAENSSMVLWPKQLTTVLSFREFEAEEEDKQKIEGLTADVHNKSNSCARKLQQQQLNQMQEKPQKQQEQQEPRPSAICAEDVIGHRMNACLSQLQNGSYQDCEKCVMTLSTGDQSPLGSRELLGRLCNLETLLLYLQLTYHSKLSSPRLKQLCLLKRSLYCLEGCLLRHSADDALVSATSSLERLERHGWTNIRRGWRRLPKGDVKHVHLAVADPQRPKVRVEPEDEWLRRYLPASDQSNLGLILAKRESLVNHRHGRDMAMPRQRGRSIRLNSKFQRDGYVDMLGRFRFAGLD